MENKEINKIQKEFDLGAILNKATYFAPVNRDFYSDDYQVLVGVPVVKDGVIYAMQISKTHGDFVVSNKHINFIFENMNSSEYSTAFRQEHGGAISQRESAHRVEYLGFRNSNEPLLTLDNMRLETQFPIYKINKMYMCYYKDITVTRLQEYSNTKTYEVGDKVVHFGDVYECTTAVEEPEVFDSNKWNEISKTGYFYTKRIFVEQDITHLVLQNTVRNTLPADWTKYPEEINSYDDMSKYKLLTVGYDIGSKFITGWGLKYSYITSWFAWTSKTKTYIETIMDLIDSFFPLGVNRYNILATDERIVDSSTSWKDKIVSPVIDLSENYINNALSNHAINFFDKLVISSTKQIGVKLKSLVFKIDYNAMYEGAIIHTKDNTDDDDYMTTDNQSSALSVLEVDGLFEKEKINRMGNAIVNFTGRYDNFEQMNNDEAHDGFNNILGAVYSDLDENGQPDNENVIIYHREYQIYDDVVLANFVGMYEYVMKHYYTTVFAKYRTYSYASYTESVRRTENDRYNVVLSFTNQTYENNQNSIDPTLLLGAFNRTIIDDKLQLNNPNSVNGGYFTFDDGNEYFADVNSFVSGYSLCFNITMPDALTAGIYIDTINCFDKRTQDPSLDNYVGSAQDWYVLPVVNRVDGFLANVGCYFGHFEDEDIVNDDE